MGIDRPADIERGKAARQAVELEEAKRRFRTVGMTSGTSESLEAADRVLRAAEQTHGGHVPIKPAGSAILKI